MVSPIDLLHLTWPDLHKGEKMKTKNTEYVKNNETNTGQELSKEMNCDLSEDEQIERFATILINIYLKLKDEENNIEQE